MPDTIEQAKAAGEAAGSNGTLKKHTMSTLAVFMMIYCLVGGGYFGCEDMVSASGPGLALLLLILVPFFWSIPQALYACELGSAIPDEGGIYVWVKRAFGEFWGFQVGWWRTLSCYIDSAVYVVLAVGYIDAFVPLTNFYQMLLKIVIILLFTWVNIRGIEEVSKVTTVLMVFVLATCVVFMVLGIMHWQYNPVKPFVPEGQTLGQSIGLGLAVAIWLYSGYESMSTMAGEIENPHVITKATLMVIPVVILVYIIPVFFGLASYGNYQLWAADGEVNFLTIVASYGIPGLGLVFLLGAALSNLSLFNSYLASASRGFYVIADDHLAPKVLSKIGKKYGTPYIAIFSMAVVDIILAQFNFEILVVVETFIFMTAYLIWFISGIALRIKEPDLERPFKIKGGIKFLVAMTIVPVIICVVTLFTNGANCLILGSIGLLTGPIFYLIFKKVYGGIDGTGKPVKKDVRSCVLLIIVTVALIGVGLSMYRSQAVLADESFANVSASLNQNATFDARHYDLANDNFYMTMTDELLGDADASVYYYQADTSGSVTLNGTYADEQAFSQAAWQAYSQFLDSNGALAVDDISISGGDYTFSSTSDETYAGADEIYQSLTASES